MGFPNEVSEKSLESQLDVIVNKLSELREVTYSYKSLEKFGGKEFNLTLFSKFNNLGLFEDANDAQNDTQFASALEKAGWLQSFFEEIKTLTENNLQENIKELENLKMQTDDENIVAIIENYIAAANFSYWAVIPELTKAGYENGLSQEEKKEIHKKLNFYDEQLFVPNVIKNATYIEDTYAYLLHLIETNKSEITEEEYEKMQDFLEKLAKKYYKNGFGDKNQKNLPKNESGRTVIILKKPYESDKEYRDPLLQELAKIKIPREDYVKIFQMYNEIAWVPQSVKVGPFACFSDKDDVFWVPNSPAYATQTAEEIARIPGHETTHYVNFKENTKDNNRVKRPWDMIKEEGLASIFEKLVVGTPLDKINYIWVWFPPVVFSQILSGKEYTSFYEVYNTLLYKNGDIGKPAHTKTTVYRKKRWYFLDLEGGSMKDTSYGIGLKEVQQYMQERLPLKYLYGWKISIDDVRSQKFEAKDFWLDQLSPFIVANFILFALEERENLRNERLQSIADYKNTMNSIKSKISHSSKEDFKSFLKEDIQNWDLHKNFVVYMKKKYSFLAPYFDNLQESTLFSRVNKYKLAQILGIFEKHRGVSNSKSV